jgi:hypothetical protein
VIPLSGAHCTIIIIFVSIIILIRNGIMKFLQCDVTINKIKLLASVIDVNVAAYFVFTGFFFLFSFFFFSLSSFPLLLLPPIPDPAQPPLSQMYLQEGVSLQIQETCDNIDLWAMWISPPVFIIFNLAYWFTYQHTEVEPTNGI